MTIVRTFDIPGLATVSLDTRDNDNPLLQITLSPDYSGDLSDIAQTTAGPDDIYLTCNHTSAINNPELAKFMEVMTHWDHNGDGNPDCDDIINAIEEALWRSRDKPNVFYRPNDGWYTKGLMAIMPPAPDRHIVFGFGELQPRFRWYHYLSAVPMIALFVLLVYAQNAAFPWMKYSVISGFLEIVDQIGIASWLGMILFMMLLFAYSAVAGDGRRPSHSPHTYGFFNKASVYEEQAFREGSENWGWFGRLRSCIAFGAIHMVNLFYPLASILPLALCGAVFMLVYLHAYRRTPFRRTAVLTAAVWHRVYNRIALGILVISLAVWFGLQAIGMLAMVGIVLSFGVVRSNNFGRVQQPAVAQEVMVTN